MIIIDTHTEREIDHIAVNRKAAVNACADGPADHGVDVELVLEPATKLFEGGTRFLATVNCCYCDGRVANHGVIEADKIPALALKVHTGNWQN